MKQNGNATWPEIFDDWRAREASNPGWVHTATVVKGWPDWESWRQLTVKQLRLDDRQWTMFGLDQPLTEIPAMLIGPHSGWQKNLPVPNVSTFGDLANIPEQAEHFAALSVTKQLRQKFPAQTRLIGLRRPDGRIVLIEGHHRAMAIALAAKDGQRLDCGDVRIALADLQPAEAGLLDVVLARGTTKVPPAGT